MNYEKPFWRDFVLDLAGSAVEREKLIPRVKKKLNNKP